MVIKLNVEGLNRLQQRLQTKAERLKDLTPFWREVGDYMKRQTINERFDKEQSPEGEKWKPLSKTAIKKRRNKGQETIKILNDNGELRRSVNYKAEKDRVKIGSNLKYSRIHQYGGKINHKRWGRYSHTYNPQKKEGQMYFYSYPIPIPARPYIGINQAERRHIVQMLQMYLERHVLNV